MCTTALGSSHSLGKSSCTKASVDNREAKTSNDHMWMMSMSIASTILCRCTVEVSHCYSQALTINTDTSSCAVILTRTLYTAHVAAPTMTALLLLNTAV